MNEKILKALDRAQEACEDIRNSQIQAEEELFRAVKLLAETVDEVPEVTELCPDCGREVTLRWDVEEDGYTISCPYCGYRMKLCSMCDARDGAVCDWDSKTGKCKHDNEVTK